jgi:hypothetical protein
VKLTKKGKEKTQINKEIKKKKKGVVTTPLKSRGSLGKPYIPTS